MNQPCAYSAMITATIATQIATLDAAYPKAEIIFDCRSEALFVSHCHRDKTQTVRE